jgi:uncharacterized protein (TIRG00374 family)
MPEEAPKHRPVRRLRSIIPAPLRHGVLIFIVLLVIEYLVIPEFVVAGKNLHILSQINIGWLITGVALEAASLLCYAALTKTLLPPGRVGLFTCFRIDLATTAVSHTIPAGSAGSAGLGYRLLTNEGVAGPEAGFAMATQGVGSAVVLNVLLWFSLVISIPIAGFHTIYVIVALVGMIALLATAALVYLLTRGEESAAHVVRAIGNKIPRVGGDRLEDLLHRIGGSLRDLLANRELRRKALVWAALNWLLDAASLWSFLLALGRFVDPVELFAAYGIANVLGVIPLTPGGLGVIDASAPALLVSFGVTKNVATLGVIGWRLVNFWLPIPVGAGAYVSLRVPRGSGLRVRRDAIKEMRWRNGSRGAMSRLANEPLSRDTPNENGATSKD